jgi:hypothetical protein
VVSIIQAFLYLLQKLYKNKLECLSIRFVQDSLTFIGKGKAKDNVCPAGWKLAQVYNHESLTEG